jgi:CheY-like chemotaxis protein
MEPTRVLVVDDAEEMLEFLEVVLRSSGYEVVTRSDAEAAFAVVRRGGIDVVLTDIFLGGPGGLELITRIRSDLPPPQPPVLAMSGFPDCEDEALRRGAARFLGKPFMVPDLLHAIQVAVAGGQPTVEAVSVARENTLELRRRSELAAERALDELAKYRDEVERRTRWGASWLTRYFGLQHMAVVVARQGRLGVETSSDEAWLATGESVDDAIPFCRDIIDSASVITLPDATRFSPLAAQQTPPIRSFAGAPLFARNQIAVGALCLLDERPSVIEPEALAVLAYLGRCMTARLETGTFGHGARFFDDVGLLTRETFQDLLGVELRYVQRRRAALELTLLALSPGEDLVVWRRMLGLMSSERRACGGLAPGLIGTWVARDHGEAAARDTWRLLETARAQPGFVGAASLAVGPAAAFALSAQAILNAAESIAARQSGGDIERLAIRDEPWREPAH